MTPTECPKSPYAPASAAASTEEPALVATGALA